MKSGVIATAFIGVIMLLAGLGIQKNMLEKDISASNDISTYQKISAQQAKEMIDAGNVTIVDVRTAQEYAEKHIKNAILVPNETIETEKPKLLPDTDAVLLVYCRSGRRSKEAADKLISIGYKHVYDFGGIIDWPYETVSGEWKNDK